MDRVSPGRKVMEGRLDVSKLNCPRQNHGVAYKSMVAFRRLKVQPLLYLSSGTNSSVSIAREIVDLYRSR